MERIESFVEKYHALSETSLSEFKELFKLKEYQKNDVQKR